MPLKPFFLTPQRPYLFTLLYLILLLSPYSWSNEHNAVTEFTLANGLTLIVKEDHRAPVATFMIWYRVGSADEPPGQTGLSHMLEHMMFKGTKKIPAGEFSTIISRQGGVDNAFTTRDNTGYYQQFSSDRVALSFKLEADRMSNLVLDEAEFEKERQVVIEERRMRVDDNPSGIAWERFYETAYVASPYQRPVIGWMHDLENLQPEDLRHWYQQWYTPNNATIVVAGDVNPEEMLKLANKYFGRIKKKPPPPRSAALEVSPKGERRLTVEAHTQVPSLLMAYNVASLNTADSHQEVYSLMMLSGVLDGGLSARIETDLVRDKKIAAGASAGYQGLSRGDALFILTGTPAQGFTLKELEQALLKQITRLQTTLATSDEIDRVKAQLKAEMIYAQDSVFGQAQEIGQLTSNGYNWNTSEQVLVGIEQVTAKQVQQAAQKYLTKNRLTVGYLIPETISTDNHTQPTE